jgi:hypothetical protein
MWPQSIIREIPDRSAAASPDPMAGSVKDMLADEMPFTDEFPFVPQGNMI